MNFADLDMLGATSDCGPPLTVHVGEGVLDTPQQKLASAALQGFFDELKINESLVPVLDAILAKSRKMIDLGIANAHLVAEPVSRVFGVDAASISPANPEDAAQARAVYDELVGQIMITMALGWYARRFGKELDCSKISITGTPETVRS